MQPPFDGGQDVGVVQRVGSAQTWIHQPPPLFTISEKWRNNENIPGPPRKGGSGLLMTVGWKLPSTDLRKRAGTDPDRLGHNGAKTQKNRFPAPRRERWAEASVVTRTRPHVVTLLQPCLWTNGGNPV